MYSCSSHDVCLWFVKILQTWAGLSVTVRSAASCAAVGLVQFSVSPAEGRVTSCCCREETASSSALHLQTLSLYSCFLSSVLWSCRLILVKVLCVWWMWTEWNWSQIRFWSRNSRMKSRNPNWSQDLNETDTERLCCDTLTWRPMISFLFTRDSSDESDGDKIHCNSCWKNTNRIFYVTVCL